MRSLTSVVACLALLGTAWADTSPDACHSPTDDCATAQLDTTPPPRHFNIVLIGATGNLATKYLWQALFDVFRARVGESGGESGGGVRFQIYGCARKEADEGRKFVDQFLLDSIRCADEPCRRLKTKFVVATQYVSLKTERDFQNLAEMLHENIQSEEGRLFYLSIPPSTYARMAQHIHAHVRPRAGRAWMRVILEKPFGRDLESAEGLAAELAGYFEEEEVYRVDHYLGKTVVKEILPFRYRNRAEYEPLWNREHIEQVDIVMKEKEDVAGRTDFYEEVGVVRDVMQSHLMELLSLVAMDLPADPSNTSALLASKLRILRALRPPVPPSTLTAQYATYNTELLSDNSAAARNMSLVPTYAASLLRVDLARWAGVPFLLVSGKKLDEKASYVRVRFRDARFCARGGIGAEMCDWRKQLIFHIGGDAKPPAMIAASRGLPAPKLPSDWSEVPITDRSVGETLLGQRVTQLMRFAPERELEAYTALLGAALDGDRSSFTSADLLLASWRAWTPALRHAERAGSRAPRQYLGGGRDSERLDVVVLSRGLRWHVDEHGASARDEKSGGLGDEKGSTDSKMYRGSPLVSGSTDDVVRRLADEVRGLIEAAQAEDRSFHLAVSGGSSAPLLFDALAWVIGSWRGVHVWLVDERCVAPTSEGSNFNVLQRHLLDNVDIPHWSVHPMVGGMTHACSTDDTLRADRLYEALIALLIPDARFDYVVLGVGPDGHTASLFPRQEALREMEQLVVYSDSGAGGGALRSRITLTFRAINAARNVAVLVLGEAKSEIVSALIDSEDVEKFPVVGVKPSDGVLWWFVDHKALLGSK